MFRSFRARITLTVIVLVGVTATLVAVVSFALVERSLQEQLIETALVQADFNLGVLAAQSSLPDDADAAALTASGLTDRFLQRGPDGVYVEFPGTDETFASDFSLVDAGRVLAPELRRLVADGNFGFEFVVLEGEAWLVVGGRRPDRGPDFYFFYSRADDEAALDRLRNNLIGAAVGVVILGALVAGIVSRSVVRPVRQAGVAARTMADGDLSVRLRAESSDELGQLADSFNAMAEALQGKLTELEQARLREQRFVADVSHELRTPLTGLVGAAGLLRSQSDELDEKEQRIAELVAHDIERLRQLVEDLLEISSLQASPAPGEVNTVDVERFLEAVISDRASTAQVSSTAGTVQVPRRALERIVGNLLDNATRHAPRAQVEIDARLLDPTRLVITVTDDGPGVPSDALPHLFDRFFSADPARQGGTGLGLAIAREHARRLGGELRVRTNQPSGLVFELVLPVTVSLRAGEADAMFEADAHGEQRNGGSR